MTKQNSFLEKICRDFIKYFELADYDNMRKILSKEIKSYVTNAEGGVNLIVGSEELIKNLSYMDVKIVKPKLNITQIAVVDRIQVMFMVEIKAKRQGKELHNFATFLLNIKDGLIYEMRMVEALPEYSDEFWKS